MASVRGALLDGELDAGSVFYGRCANTYWAIGRFTGPIGSEGYAFRRDRGQRTWVTLAGVSDDSHYCKVPREMLRVWKIEDSAARCERTDP